MRFGQVEQFLHAGTEPDAEPFAASDRDQRLGQLEAFVERVGPGIEEGFQALQAVVLEQRSPDQRRRNQDRQEPEVAQARAAKPDHAQGDSHEQGGAAEIGLGQQKHDQQRGDPKRFADAEQARLHIVAMAHQIAGQVHDQDQLDHFHRLESGYAEIDPAARAVDAHADARHEDQQKQDEGEQKQQEGMLLDQRQFGPRNQDGETRTEAEKDQVTGQVVEGADLLVVGD